MSILLNMVRHSCWENSFDNIDTRKSVIVLIYFCILYKMDSSIGKIYDLFRYRKKSLDMSVYKTTV